MAIIKIKNVMASQKYPCNIKKIQLNMLRTKAKLKVMQVLLE